MLHGKEESGMGGVKMCLASMDFRSEKSSTDRRQPERNRNPITCSGLKRLLHVECWRWVPRLTRRGAKLLQALRRRQSFNRNQESQTEPIPTQVDKVTVYLCHFLEGEEADRRRNRYRGPGGD